jgi:ArsR family transcriptional regulator, arsenate/arsenite/antimonite-responsive transcriptional repressor
MLGGPVAGTGSEWAMSATRPGFPVQLAPASDVAGASWFDTERTSETGGDRSRHGPSPVVFSAAVIEARSAAVVGMPRPTGGAPVDGVTVGVPGSGAGFGFHPNPNPNPVPDSDPEADVPLPRDDAVRMTTVLKAIAHPARLQLISIVQAGEHGEACVSDMTAPLRLSQPAVSHHLKILVEAGLMRRVRRGNWAWYSFVPTSLEAILEALKLL